MNENEVSVKEMLQMTVDTINAIQVPVSLADQIARPLCGAVANILAVIDAIKDAPKENKPEEGDENV